MDFYTYNTGLNSTVVRGSEWFKPCDIQIVNIDNIEDVRQWDIIVSFYYESILCNVLLGECKTAAKAGALLLLAKIYNFGKYVRLSVCLFVCPFCQA